MNGSQDSRVMYHQMNERREKATDFCVKSRSPRVTEGYFNPHHHQQQPQVYQQVSNQQLPMNLINMNANINGPQSISQMQQLAISQQQQRMQSYSIQMEQENENQKQPQQSSQDDSTQTKQSHHPHPVHPHFTGYDINCELSFSFPLGLSLLEKNSFA